MNEISEMLGVQWRPNCTLKVTLAKLCQKNHENWFKLLIDALIFTTAAPKGKPKINPIEMLYGRSFPGGTSSNTHPDVDTDLAIKT
jgi:hypothetical protein